MIMLCISLFWPNNVHLSAKIDNFFTSVLINTLVQMLKWPWAETLESMKKHPQKQITEIFSTALMTVWSANKQPKVKIRLSVYK